MLNAFTIFCESKNIAINQSKTILAVSGGVDSVVLAHIFYQLGFDFVIAHCNFDLRGKESDEDEQYVKLLAEKMKVPFHVKKIDTVSYAQTNGVSIQMAARDLRYNWFEELRKQTGSTQVATAHHKGDVAETMLFNLAKGTGLEGLHGIKAKSNHLIRPLLFASRDDIIAFATHNKLTWREDSSNTSTKYSRNKIRHLVVPVLEEINPRAQEAIYNTSKRIEELELFLKHKINELSERLIEKQEESFTIDSKQLTQIAGYQYVLSEILKPLGFSYQQSSEITKSLFGLSGKLFFSKTHVVNIDRNKLIVSSISSVSNGISIESERDNYKLGKLVLSTKTQESSAYQILSDSTILAFDKEQLKFPLKIRTWEKGDSFYPLGMKGKKKLSDYMIDVKIPVNLKNQIWVVVSDGEIAGVLNHRLDERFKITEKTKRVFEIKIN